MLKKPTAKSLLGRPLYLSVSHFLLLMPHSMCHIPLRMLSLHVHAFIYFLNTLHVGLGI